MKLRDIVERVIIDPRKLTDYALALNSPYGRHKAILFERLLGITQENCTILLKQLEDKVLEAEASFHSKDEFGKRYQIDIMIEGIEGRQATVRTGWLVPPVSDQAHLVTLYVRKR